MTDMTNVTRVRVVDLETTGFAPPAAVVEIGGCDVVAKARDLVGAPTHWTVEWPWSALVNPGISIPPETSAVHHLIDDDVRVFPPWSETGPIFARTLDADGIGALAAHSAKMERQWIDDLAGGRPWICTYKCALRVWPEAPSHSNQALRYWRRPVGLDRAKAMPAHRAGPDAYVTAFLLRDLLEAARVEDLIQWSSEPALQVRCHIGKWRGTPWREVDDSFLEWVIARDFDEDVLFTVRNEIERRDNERQEASAA